MIMILGLWTLLKAKDSESWPSTQGTIITSELSRDDSYDSETGQKTTMYSANIVYEYSVDGVRRSCDAVSFVSVSGSDLTDARKNLSRYPYGMTVAVYYDPDNADDAILEPGVQQSTWSVLCFGLVFSGVGSLFILLLWYTNIGSILSNLTKKQTLMRIGPLRITTYSRR
ncbi:DUF3592 domain-containing protein [Persicirhabdus sediminis]|uniref:DUF3592 domain-containing protein n=1 Tax=Persicirhabdus sediminis TaxID=454144 RepID=A0A8J7SJ47_9BACT|nr:DUF3592 domain-containing protein [Persicirhabdus sediminis]